MEFLRDLRLAGRNLGKAPGYAASAILTLALAIGATSALFSVVHAVLLKPLPIVGPERLVVVWEKGQTADQGVSELSYRNFRDWSDGVGGFSHLAAMGSSNWSEVLDGHGDPVRLHFSGVTASFFDTLGARPLLGRTLQPEDDVPNAARVVVLNHGTWVRRFGADPGVLGRTMRFTDKLYTIVGVMPRGFDFPRGAELWKPVVPILAQASEDWKTDALTHVGVLFVVGRLRDGVTAEQAREELDGLARRLQSEAAPRFGASVAVTPFLDFLLGPVRPALRVLFAAVGVLLLIACANVSGLVLTRVALRRREDAVRLALGATRARLGRLWAAETLLLALAGGVLGLALSHWIAAAVVALGPDDVPRLAEVAIDLRVGLFTFVVVLVAALLCAAAPMRQAGRKDLLDALHDAARGSAGRAPLRARSTLLTLQIGLAVTLLLAAGLVVRSFHNLRRLDLGFDPTDVLTMKVNPRNPGLPQNVWFEELLAQVSARPGTVAAGAVSLRPLALGSVGQGSWFALEGQPATPEGT
jgi:predicted permease